MSKSNESPSYDGRKTPVSNPYHRPNVIMSDSESKINPYSKDDPYNNNPHEVFVPVANITPVINRYQPNATIIRMPPCKTRPPSPHPPRTTPPPPKEEDQTRAQLAKLIKSGKATNPNIDKEREIEIRHAAACSDSHVRRGYNLHKRMIATLLNDNNLKFLCQIGMKKKTHQVMPEHVLEVFLM